MCKSYKKPNHLNRYFKVILQKRDEAITLHDSHAREKNANLKTRYIYIFPTYHADSLK